MGTAPVVQWVTRLIGRQVVQLSRLVDDLLDVSRITSGKIQLRQEPLDLCAVVAAAVESMRSLLGGQPVGTDIWVALAWCAGITVVAYYFAMRAYNRVA